MLVTWYQPAHSVLPRDRQGRTVRATTPTCLPPGHAARMYQATRHGSGPSKTSVRLLFRIRDRVLRLSRLFLKLVLDGHGLWAALYEGQ